MDEKLVEDFRQAVLDHYRDRGRSFPWRETDDPWLILISEVMLQQTQTERVIPYWERWRSLWPTPGVLAKAPLDLVLRAWSGLGYNRRGRFLKQAAERIVAGHAGKVPSSVEELEALPGIGPYTARAIACFAYGSSEPFVETNIRAAALHFFFSNRDGVKDEELLPLLSAAMDRSDPRRWHWALMDYGAALKRYTPNPNRRSAHYTRQSRFSGSLREARGIALRSLAADGPASLEELVTRTDLPYERLADALNALVSDSMVREDDYRYVIP